MTGIPPLSFSSLSPAAAEESECSDAAGQRLRAAAEPYPRNGGEPGSARGTLPGWLYRGCTCTVLGQAARTAAGGLEQGGGETRSQVALGCWANPCQAWGTSPCETRVHWDTKSRSLSLVVPQGGLKSCSSSVASTQSAQ